MVIDEAWDIAIGRRAGRAEMIVQVILMLDDSPNFDAVRKVLERLKAHDDELQATDAVTARDNERRASQDA